MIINRIKSIAGKNISQFLYANVLYTISTGLISLLSPFIMRQEVYEQFIYIFQNVMFLCGVFSLGLVPTLLRYYKFDQERYRSYFISTCCFLITIIITFGFFPSNPASQALKIVTTLPESVIIYFSVASQLVFIFNRGMLAAEESYRKMNIDICIIFVLRCAAIIYIYFNQDITLKNALLIICIAPMSVDLIRFAASTAKIKYTIFDRTFFEFLSFSIKIFLVGIVYNITNRLFVINVKNIDDSLAAVISFSAGIVGIISILNTTFSSYFIGKLDSRNPDGVYTYLSRIRKFTPFFLVCTLLLAFTVASAVYIVYPYNALQAAIYSGLTIFFSAMMFFVGLKTLLCKTYNMMNLQLFMNIICCISVFAVLKSMVSTNYYLIFCVIHLLLLATELVLARIVEYRIRPKDIK